jgi:RNase P subunit RPR2
MKLQADKYPAQFCPDCKERMTLNKELNVLLHFEPPNKIISSGGMPVVTYVCQSCGLIRFFEATTLTSRLD